MKNNGKKLVLRDFSLSFWSFLGEKIKVTLLIKVQNSSSTEIVCSFLEGRVADFLHMVLQDEIIKCQDTLLLMFVDAIFSCRDINSFRFKT